MPVKTVKTMCFECHSRCGVILEVKNGKVAGIKGDKEHPFSHGHPCPKGRAYKEILYHPERIKKPLVKVGNRKGEHFEEAPWDKALEIIYEKLLGKREQWGVESFVIGMDTTRGTAPYLGRFLSVQVDRFIRIKDRPSRRSNDMVMQEVETSHRYPRASPASLMTAPALSGRPHLC